MYGEPCLWTGFWQLSLILANSQATFDPCFTDKSLDGMNRHEEMLHTQKFFGSHVQFTSATCTHQQPADQQMFPAVDVVIC